MLSQNLTCTIQLGSIRDSERRARLEFSHDEIGRSRESCCEKGTSDGGDYVKDGTVSHSLVPEEGFAAVIAQILTSRHACSSDHERADSTVEIAFTLEDS